jgi:hypothetical protein
VRQQPGSRPWPVRHHPATPADRAGIAVRCPFRHRTKAPCTRHHHRAGLDFAGTPTASSSVM